MKHKIPVMSADPSSAETNDVLAAWGFDYYKMGVVTGKLVARILNGASPADIPTVFMTEPSETPEYRRARHIGRIFQDPLRGTASNMSVEANMMIACRKGFKWPIISLNRKMRDDFRVRLEQLDMDLHDRMKEPDDYPQHAAGHRFWRPFADDGQW